MVESPPARVCVCQSKSKLKDLVSRIAETLLNGQTAVVLGKAKTIAKAVSSVEIVKRPLDGEVEQQTRIYRQSFQGKTQNCIEIKLAVYLTDEVRGKLQELKAQNEGDKTVNHRKLPNAR